MGTGALLGLNACRVQLFSTVSVSSAAFPWPAAGNSLIGMDALSAFFLVPILVVEALGAVYGLAYWNAGQHPQTARKLQFFWGTMGAGMVLLVIARHAMAFLLGWEIMALSAFFLVSTEDDKAESRRAGLVYIFATHIGTLALFCLFAYWRLVTGSFALDAIPPGSATGTQLGVLFLLALLGFGLKAGIMPLHFWLPGAHANAPSHVSAVLSGVLLKTGVYGILRICLLLPEPPLAWGVLVLALGAASSVLGVLFALGQHDLKRLLAYHSVENIGIIFMGMGLAFMGRATGNAGWIVLGMAGCLLHVWNHSFFKSLLFMGAGSVLHATGTRNIDSLGGLAKKMPWTSVLFLVGAVAICGLPPLNGFISESFVYLGLIGALGAGGIASAVALAAPLLAMTGALAVACFVKAFGSVFLGSARTGIADSAHEASVSMLAPMTVLAGFCIFIGLFPASVAPVLDRVTAAVVPMSVLGTLPSLGTFLPLGTFGTLALVLVGGISAVSALVFLLMRRIRTVVTWDCGYARPTSSMQYTASSFAQSIVAMFAWILHPLEHRTRVLGAFPGRASMSSHIDDAVLDGLLIPGARKAELRTEWFHRFQQGLTQNYILYVLVALALLLCTLIPFRELLKLLSFG